MKFAIYLHTNGCLIQKNEMCYKADPQYFDSPFVRHVWYLSDESDKTDWLSLFKQALVRGAKPLEVQRVAKEHGLFKESVELIFNFHR